VSEADLVDVLKAITYLQRSIDVLASSLPPEAAQQRKSERQGFFDSVMAILNRHDIPLAGDDHA